MAGLAFPPRPLTGAATRAAATELLRARRAWRHARQRPGGRADLYRPEAAGTRARAGARTRDCCCSTNGWPGSTRPNCCIGIELIRSLRDDGLTIILVEHVMDAIRSLCDRCIVMNSGRKIAEGTPGRGAGRPRGGRRLSRETPMLEVSGLSVAYGKHRALERHRARCRRAARSS